MTLLDFTTPEEAMEMDWRLFVDDPLEWCHVQHVAGLFQCYWQYPGEYRADQAHAEWSSGLHSADFFNFKGVLEACEPFRELVASKFIARFRELGVEFTAIVGSATGSDMLVESIGKLTGVRVIKMKKGEGKAQEWVEGQALLTGHDVVGHAEELTSTVATPPRVMEAIYLRHEGIVSVRFAPYMVVGVDRRPKESQDANPQVSLGPGKPVMVPLFSFPSMLYQPGPATCPMCAAGSAAVIPRQNWDLLTGKKLSICTECGDPTGPHGHECDG